MKTDICAVRKVWGPFFFALFPLTLGRQGRTASKIGTHGEEASFTSAPITSLAFARRDAHGVPLPLLPSGGTRNKSFVRLTERQKGLPIFRGDQRFPYIHKSGIIRGTCRGLRRFPSSGGKDIHVASLSPRSEWGGPFDAANQKVRLTSGAGQYTGPLITRQRCPVPTQKMAVTFRGSRHPATFRSRSNCTY